MTNETEALDTVWSLTRSNTIFGDVLLFILVVSVIGIALIFVIGFWQGRSITIWRMKMGARPQAGYNTGPSSSEDMLNRSDKVLRNQRKSKSTSELSTGQNTRIVKELESKLADLNEIDQIPVALLGSTYLDVHLTPVSTDKLDADEWSDLDAIRIAIGGSAMCVGRFLYADYGERSHLYTQQSCASDSLSVEFRRLLQIEQVSWMANEIGDSESEESAPVTFLLNQLDRSYASMFTHKGSLIDFSWDSVGSEIADLLKDGGVLYLSGFMKTSLSLALAENLKKLHPKVLICLDHGRLNVRTDDPSKLNSIYQAFSDGLIDVYICTRKELTDFVSTVKGRPLDVNQDDPMKLLAKVIEVAKLPPVTIVRSKVGERSILAHSIVSGCIDAIPDNSRRMFNNTPVAPLNAFNAAVVHYLAKENIDSAGDLRSHVVNVCQNALKACHKKRGDDPIEN